MDLTKVLEGLRRELEHLDAAILSLERLQVRVARRRRPAKVLSDLRKPLSSPVRETMGQRRAYANRKRP